VDSTALRNLELLSNLYYTDKSHLNRVRIIGKWLQGNQCQLPVAKILNHYPRCYCNFNPMGHMPSGILINQINLAIRNGIDYFRNALRKCSNIVVEEVKAQRIDEAHAKQIAALLSQGQMVPLKLRAINILNGIIQKHSTAFIAGMCSTDKK
jgi:hypothetical protein